MLLIIIIRMSICRFLIMKNWLTLTRFIQLLFIYIIIVQLGDEYKEGDRKSMKIWKVCACCERRRAERRRGPDFDVFACRGRGGGGEEEGCNAKVSVLNLS